MNTLKAWSDDEDESSTEVLDEGEDEVDDVREDEEINEHDYVGAVDVLPGDGDDAQRLTQVGCALGLTQVEGVELLQGPDGVVVVGGEVVEGGGEVDDTGSGRLEVTS